MEGSMNKTVETLGQMGGIKSGLEGIPAAETALSHVDGAAGELILCGAHLKDFAAAHSYESAAALFWATAREEASMAKDEVRARLGAARVAAFARLDALLPSLGGLCLSEALRLGLAAVPEDEAPHIAVTGAIPVILAAAARAKEGKAPVAPDASLTHAADFLRMLRGAPTSEAEVAALTTYLVTVMDHGMNASTFTARVIASTGAGLTWAALGGFAALTGPLHGGAPEPVLNMLEEVGTPARAESWVAEQLEKGERLMGFGHRIYKVRDPRADVLKAALEKLNPSGEKLALARAVEDAALAALKRHKPDRPLETNVEFYTAMLLDGLALPRAGFTPVFAMGRVAGWTAHAMEQQRTGRLIRPASLYVGRKPVREEWR